MRTIRTRRDAEREARARKRDNDRNNRGSFQMEVAYSPATLAVGMRWQDPCEPEWSEVQSYAVWNIDYPMYGRADQVSDWISVGTTIPKR